MPFGIPAEDFNGGFGLPEKDNYYMNITYPTNRVFSEKMSSSEAISALSEYAASHRGEDLSQIKKEFSDVMRKIIIREMHENRGHMTSHHAHEGC